MNQLLNINDRLSRFAETCAVALIFGYCMLMLTEVIARGQASSFSFTWEFSQYSMAAIFALAAGPTVRTGVHVRISLLSEMMPERVGKWLDIMANLVALAIVFLIVTALWTKVSISFERNILATSVTKSPLWIPQSLVLWGFAQLWLDLLARLARRLTDRPYEWRNSDADLSAVDV